MNFNSQNIRIEQTFSGTKSKVNHTMTKKNKQREIELKSNKEGFMIYKGCMLVTSKLYRLNISSWNPQQRVKHPK